MLEGCDIQRLALAVLKYFESRLVSSAYQNLRKTFSDMVEEE
jgi:hypothetical protein